MLIVRGVMEFAGIMGITTRLYVIAPVGSTPPMIVSLELHIITVQGFDRGRLVRIQSLLLPFCCFIFQNFYSHFKTVQRVDWSNQLSLFVMFLQGLG